MRRVIDVSQVIESLTPLGAIMPPDVRPAHSEPFSDIRRREDIMFLLRIEDAQLVSGDTVLDRLQYLTATADPAGTHVETYYPAKWFYNGEGAHRARDVADLPTRTLVNEASIIDIADTGRPVGPGDLVKSARHLKEGDGVIFRSGLNRAWEDAGLGDSGKLADAYSQQTGITSDATRWLTDRHIRLCAMDFRTPEDPHYKWELPSHKQLHVNDVLIIEDIAHLDRVSQERLLLIVGAPIKGRHLTGGPARIFGVEGWGTTRSKVVDLSHIMGTYPRVSERRQPRQEPAEDAPAVLSRADFMFFDIGQTGLSDLVGPQYMRVSSRAGTHLLNPAKPDADGAGHLFVDVAEIPADRLAGPAVLIDMTHVGAGRSIGEADLAQAIDTVREGDWVVLRTDHADWHQGRPDSAARWSPRLSTEAIAMIGAAGARGIITDLTAAATIEDQPAVEAALHEHNLLLVAGARRLWLSRRTRSFAAVLPLPIRGLVHSPAHVFLIEDWADGQQP